MSIVSNVERLERASEYGLAVFVLATGAALMTDTALPAAVGTYVGAAGLAGLRSSYTFWDENYHPG